MQGFVSRFTRTPYGGTDGTKGKSAGWRLVASCGVLLGVAEHIQGAAHFLGKGVEDRGFGTDAFGFGPDVTPHGVIERTDPAANGDVGFFVGSAGDTVTAHVLDFHSLKTTLRFAAEDHHSAGSLNGLSTTAATACSSPTRTRI